MDQLSQLCCRAPASEFVATEWVVSESLRELLCLLTELFYYVWVTAKCSLKVGDSVN